MSNDTKWYGLKAALGLLGLVGTIWMGGVWVATTYATVEDLQVVASQAQYALDKQMEYILKQINRIEAKQKKSQDDYEQLRYLRGELQRLRDIRRGA